MALLAQVPRHAPLTASRLAELLAIERSTVVRDLQVLERMDLVRRTRTRAIDREVSPDGLDHDPVVLRKMAETHLVEQAALCDRIILDFLEHELVLTLAPIRRR